MRKIKPDEIKNTKNDVDELLNLNLEPRASINNPRVRNTGTTK